MPISDDRSVVTLPVMSALQDLLAKPKLVELRQRPGLRYLVVGGSTYVFELAVIVVAQHLGASAVTAVAVSFWFGLFVSFTLQKLVTFGDKRTHHKVVLPQIGAFSVLVMFNFGFTIVVTRLLEHTLPVVAIRTLAIGVTTLWNYYLYKTRIFVVPVID
jgi:putative flippase GtrA